MMDAKKKKRRKDDSLRWELSPFTLGMVVTASTLSCTTFPAPAKHIKKYAKKRNREDQRLNMNLISSNVSDNTKIGVFLMALGSLFLWLGVMFLFDSVLLGLGNVCFCQGLYLSSAL